MKVKKVRYCVQILVAQKEKTALLLMRQAGIILCFVLVNLYDAYNGNVGVRRGLLDVSELCILNFKEKIRLCCHNHALK